MPWKLLLACFLWLLVGCGASAWAQPAPATDDRSSLRRLIGSGAMDKPLLPQPGNIWADVMPVPLKSAPPARAALHRGGASPGPAAAAVPPAAVPRVVDAAPVAPAKPTGLQVQLTAATSAQAAIAAWRRLRQSVPLLTSGHDPAVDQAEVQGRQVWRLRTGGFADRAEASAFCAGIRAAKGDCWIVPAASGL